MKKKEYQDFTENFISKLTYKEMLKNKDFPNLKESELEKIKDILLNSEFHKYLKPLIQKLYEYTSLENLLYCVLNLYNVNVENKKKFIKEEPIFRFLDGSYDHVKNLIIYSNKSDIPHEFLHLCSTRPTLNRPSKQSGFHTHTKDIISTTGLNEGYTELLSRRIFFDENYNTTCYTKNVYTMRLFELLYNNKEEIESDYFKADFNNLLNHFLKYGTLEELNQISTILNKLGYQTTNEEKIELFNTINNIIQKTEDKNKIDKADKITEEYYSKEHIAPKSFYLKQKRHN